MITEVTLKNFKSIKDISRLKLKPLTIFTGTNSSGKSNILEGIALFAEGSRLRGQFSSNPVTLENIYSQGDFRKYPPQQVKNFLSYKKQRSNIVTIEVMMNLENRTRERIKKLYEINDLKSDSSFATTTSVGYYYEFKSQYKYFAQGITLDDKTLIAVSKAGSQRTKIEIPDKFEKKAISGDVEHFFDTTVFKFATNDEAVLDTRIGRIILNYFKTSFERVYLLSGERGSLEAERNMYSGPVPSWVGYRGQNVIEILSRMLVREPNKAEQIRVWANKFQLPNIRVGYIGENKLEADFTDQELGIGLNSALAGLGARQILSIIVQIFSAKRNSVIMVEEPEISLHPEQQVLLHELFATAVKQGKQIICTSHSPFLILALSRIVRNKMMSVEDIAIYHIEKEKIGTKAKELKLNKNGFLVGGVPSFMKTEHELFQDWSESLEEE